MRARFQTVLDKLANLLGWRFLRAGLVWIHSYLASKLDDRPGLIGWLWRLIHIREWQKSTAASSAFWVLNTLIVYSLVERLGHGWQVNVAVSLGWDVITYAVNKRWVWRRRKVSLSTSGCRNFLFWGLFFAVNGALGWLLMGRSDVGTLEARGLLGCYGIAMNPVIFTIRDRVVFNQLTLRGLAFAGWQFLRQIKTA